MLDRVGVDVIDMTMQVLLVPNHMLSITPLPETSFSLAHPAVGNALAIWEHSRKTGFDQTPAHWKVVVPWGQAPQTMEVVRQDHHCFDHKWMVMHRQAECFAQCLTMFLFSNNW